MVQTCDKPDVEARVFLVMMAALLACDDNSRCYGYCADRSDIYPSLVEDGDTTGLPGYGGATEFDRAAYLDTCGSAPEGQSCDECSGWYSEVFLTPAGLSDSCDEVYERVDTQPSDTIYQQLLDECRETCDVHGLDFET